MTSHCPDSDWAVPSGPTPAPLPHRDHSRQAPGQAPARLLLPCPPAPPADQLLQEKGKGRDQPAPPGHIFFARLGQGVMRAL